MQVTHTVDHVTHAVIGGLRPIEFEVSNNAEFLHMLSSTLYSDQILAVVREVLCNAWDIHIQCGIQDKPFEITFKDDFLTIRDFGSGIHHDNIGPIYGVYGSSTKKHDGNQTGGFGLGCKAPFAYADHFEVISWHQGVKTIYNMSKSSSAIGGKPGIIPIVSLPTTESGLQVKIPIQAADRHRFTELIGRIVSNGEMLATYNGTRLPVLPFSEMKHDFLVTNDRISNTGDCIYVRYGNVIYPIPAHPAYERDFNEIKSFVKKIHIRDRHGYGSNIVLQAPAHSISVTPSREVLSMSDHTVNTLSALLRQFLNQKEKEFDSDCFAVLRERMEHTAKSKQVGLMMYPIDSVLGLTVNTSNQGNSIVKMGGLARKYLTFTYPDIKGFRQEDFNLRLKYLTEAMPQNRGLIQTLYKTVKRGCITGSEKYAQKSDCDWLQRQVIAPLFVKMMGNPEMSPDRLFVCPYKNRYSNKHYMFSRFLKNTNDLMYATNAIQAPPEELLPFLRNIIVITHSRTEIVNRIAQYPEITTSRESSRGYMVYQVARSEKKRQAALDFFAKTGMKVMDLTVHNAWESAAVVAKPIHEKREPTPEGYPVLKASAKNFGLNFDKLRESDVKRIVAPTFVAKLLTKVESPGQKQLCDFSISASELIVKHFGHIGVGVVRESQVEKLKREGVADCRQWVVAKVCSEMTNNPKIQAYLSVREMRAEIRYAKENFDEDVMDLIRSNLALSTELGMADPREDYERDICYIWDSLLSNYAFNAVPEVITTAEHIAKIPVNPIVVSLKGIAKASTLLPLIDLGVLRRMLNSPEKGSYTKARELFFLALNT